VKLDSLFGQRDLLSTTKESNCLKMEKKSIKRREYLKMEKLPFSKVKH